MPQISDGSCYNVHTPRSSQFRDEYNSVPYTKHNCVFLDGWFVLVRKPNTNFHPCFMFHAAGSEEYCRRRLTHDSISGVDQPRLSKGRSRFPTVERHCFRAVWPRRPLHISKSHPLPPGQLNSKRCRAGLFLKTWQAE